MDRQVAREWQEGKDFQHRRWPYHPNVITIHVNSMWLKTAHPLFNMRVSVTFHHASNAMTHSWSSSCVQLCLHPNSASFGYPIRPYINYYLLSYEKDNSSLGRGNFSSWNCPHSFLSVYYPSAFQWILLFCSCLSVSPSCIHGKNPGTPAGVSLSSAVALDPHNIIWKSWSP